jgi:hypothetical protein
MFGEEFAFFLWTPEIAKTGFTMCSETLDRAVLDTLSPFAG